MEKHPLKWMNSHILLEKLSKAILNLTERLRKIKRSKIRKIKYKNLIGNSKTS